MNPDEVLEHLRLRGPIESRLYEDTGGDRERFQHAPNIGTPPASESELLSALHQLEKDGLVSRREDVHPNDTCEYIVTWQAN